MTVLFGLLYVFYFIVLGHGFNTALSHVGQQQATSNPITFSFFQGVVIHVILFNFFQFFSLSNNTLLILTTVIWLIFCLFSIRHLVSGSITIKPNLSIYLNTAVVLALTVLIYSNGSLLPNIAWDSWSVWEGKAHIWLQHGLHTEIHSWDKWINSTSSMFSHSPNYPDGLSLIYYFPGLLKLNGFAVTYIVYLFAFAALVILVSQQAAKLGAPVYLQIFMVVIFYTTPFISNHLMIQGYADLWLGMYLLLIILGFKNHIDQNKLSSLLPLAIFLIMLPMLKIEGWVWLSLILMAYLIIRSFSLNQGKWIIWASIGTIVVLIPTIGIDLNLPFGDLIINTEKIVLFNLFDVQYKFVNITNQLWVSFLWQNNWSIIWVGLPFLLTYTIMKPCHKATQTAIVFLALALSGLLFLFYFTEASQWAKDFTAINRVLLQLTPCYLFLLLQMIAQIYNYKPSPNT